jgi:hypothetical protein
VSFEIKLTSAHRGGARGGLGTRWARLAVVHRRVHGGSVVPQSEQRPWSQTNTFSRSFPPESSSGTTESLLDAAACVTD